MKPSQPAVFLHFLRWFCHPQLLPYVEGDLIELYEERLQKLGKQKADLRFRIDVLLLFRPSIIRPMEGSTQLNRYGMFKSYFKVGIRNILKYKIFSFINVSGLALAMSVCMLIILMIADQKSYDQFHEKKDRTYRILSKKKESSKPNASCPSPLGSSLKADYSIVDETTTLTLGIGGDAVYKGQSAPMRGFFAEPSFFKIFSFQLEHGHPERALEHPNSIVITHAFAQRLFMDDNPVGKTIDFTDRGLDIIPRGGRETPPVNWGAYTITGVIADDQRKSHLKFDALVSASSMKGLYGSQKMQDITHDWTTYSRTYTYAILLPGKSASDLRIALNHMASVKYKDIAHLQEFQLIGQNLTEITPGMFVGNPPSLSLPVNIYYYLILLGLAIMLCACLNYVNLSTARSLTRAKEIGIRKVAGAYKRSVIFQFLSESVLTAFLSLLMASLLLFLFLKSAFLNLWVNQYLHFDLQPGVWVFVVFIVFSLLIGLTAGIYPAFRLSAYQPIAALKGAHIPQPGKFKAGTIKVISTFQLVISLFFITTSLLIHKQFKHFMEFKYEFSPEYIVNVPLQGNAYELLKNELSAVPGVEGVSACSFIPATGMAHGSALRKSGSDGEYISSEILQVDEHFFLNLKLRLLAGKNLPPKGHADHIVVNEAAALALGYKHPSEIIGEVLDNGKMVEVIGVVENFRFKTPMMADKIGPLYLMNQPEEFDFLNVRVASDDPMSTIESLEEKWKSIDDTHPFQYRFFTDELKNANQSIGDVVAIMGYISFIAITIACMGMLGMATHTTERRIKEVSIRKILGAPDSGILFLLSKGFVKLLALAVLISAPLSYFFNKAWLEGFPNRVDFGVGIILWGSLILVVFGGIAIASQTVRASRRKPVEALKMD